MKLTTQDFNDLRVVTVCTDRIDAACTIQFKDELRELAADAPSRMVLDMTQVEFLDSSGLGAVVASMKAMPEGTKLELAGLKGAVERVFQLTRMNTVFTIHDDTNAAMTPVQHAS